MDKYRIDSGKLQFHPQWVARWLEADTWEKAKSINPIYWEVTSAANCNHRCTFCSVDAIGYPDIQIDADVLIEQIMEASDMGVKSIMFGGTGEPLLHPEIEDIAGAASSWLDVAFTTNGVALNRLKNLNSCSWVKISLNAGTKESYAAIHKTKERDWHRVWENIKDAAKRKGDCALGVQCVVLPENYKDMHALAFLAMESGADYLVLKPYSNATFSIVHREDIDYRTMHSDLAAVRDEFAGYGFNVIYKENAMRQESEGHHYKVCHATPHAWVYSMADGRVFTCSAHLMDDRFCIGNLNNQTFQEIWEGEGRRKQWELMKTFDVAQCRKNCRQNTNNIYLEGVKNGVPHQAFI